MEERTDEERRRALRPLKIVFALEYVLQGLVNPFQGASYQPFLKRFESFGLDEAATQRYFSQSYLAWSFKPVLGFLVDAYGRTRTILTALLAAAIAGYLLTPFMDWSAASFFGWMFGLSVVLAMTDVAVDRATVAAGDEEARASGRPRSTTVGLNQAICWTAIYGTGAFAGFLGGVLREEVSFDLTIVGFAVVPAALLIAVRRLPRDRAVGIPIRESAAAFWRGLHTGPILGIVLFYFLFHFQPALGAIFTNYQYEVLALTPKQVGIGDAFSYGGLFVGVLLFAWKGVKWQERFGLRRMLEIYILLSIGLSLSTYLVLDPMFSRASALAARIVPFAPLEEVRVGYLCLVNFTVAIGLALVRMTTFSLVGAVIPVAAAGSLFAGFMSVANLGYSFSYRTGAWLYEHGIAYEPLRWIQSSIFGIDVDPGRPLSLHVLVLIGSAAYLLSFLAIRFVPTDAGAPDVEVRPGPERWRRLSAKSWVDRFSLLLGAGVFLAVFGMLGTEEVSNAIASAIAAFFITVMVRQAVLDFILRRAR